MQEPLFLQPVFQEKFGAAIVYTRYLVSIYRAIKLVKIGQSVHIHMALVLFLNGEFKGKN